MKRVRGGRWAWLCVGSLGALSLGGCSSQKEVIQVTAEGRRAPDAQIDQDAWRLLPPGAVVWLRADAKELFDADFGPQVGQLLKEALPFAQGAGVDPKKDIDLVVGGLYATVGSDVVGICKGRFRKDATAAAIKTQPKSGSGRSIQSTKYAGTTMHVADQVAMAVLTDSTLVFGTQLGVRRVLERVEEGRLERNIPPWYEALLGEGAAHFQIGIDLDSQAVPATLGEKLAFMKGLRAGRLLGNFREPGLNLAGTLTYSEPLLASQAAETLSNAQESLAKYEFILRALGIDQPLRRLDAQATDKDTQVVVELHGQSLARFLENSSEILDGTEAKDWLPN